jgi:hypothetical protein
MAHFCSFSSGSADAADPSDDDEWAKLNSVMRQKCVKNASKMRQNASKMRQNASKCVKNASCTCTEAVLAGHYLPPFVSTITGNAEAEINK